MVVAESGRWKGAAGSGRHLITVKRKCPSDRLFWNAQRKSSISSDARYKGIVIWMNP